MRKLVPDNIENLALYPPGKPLEEVQREYGITEVIKLASNENALGPSPKAVKAIRESLKNIYRYPDNSARNLKLKLAEKYGVAPEQIILGNGSNELVQFILLTFLLPGEEVITGKPTFLLYRLMSRALGAKVTEVPLKDFVFDLEAMAQELKQETKLIFISNPNNPTGTIVSKDALEKFMARVPQGVIVVIDEAYFEYVTSRDYPDLLDSIKENNRNIIILRTFSKAYGLAGLRVGYGISQANLISYMDRVREPFNVNYLAQIGAVAALEDQKHLKRTRENNRIGFAYLSGELKKLGIGFVATQANYILINVGARAETVYEKLLRDGVIVRCMTDFGLHDYIRLTIGLPEENERFISSFKKVMGIH